MNRRLQFRSDGTFTIVQFSDLHWQNGEPADHKTRDLMKRILEQEQPDLIVFTGDIIFSPKAADPRKAIRQAVSAAEESGIPWAAVFGNHDSERMVSREELFGILREHEGCVAKPTEPGVSGVGNYVLPIADAEGNHQAELYFLDSGAVSRVPWIRGYDWIRRDQIAWYLERSEKLQADRGGEVMPSLVFFHIPLPEYNEVWKTRKCYGHRHEKPASPRVNSGFFAAMAERGDVLGTFCGHDHTNDYEGELLGIRLCYGRASGYQAYGRPFYSRGARVIRLRAGKREFETWVTLRSGRRIEHPRVHQPWGYWLKEKLRKWF
ncbi:metallophosphoesterase [Cohnella pontilimi]|uniref:Metallophosphoesterase n=1 Tax=Cohnella pontilimi TaxID=2564100 RepID=A0A4U0FBU2_9BACL|nr:metallophosphoesterase family protein [Cohnella pontilimi]TJY42187.1 metallophosphoesterase [Cohnella pontilimi]